MKDIIVTNGIVLSAMSVGEYDRRVVLLTKELGKISAFARGVRRQNSPLLAGTRPFTFGIFSLYPGRNAYTLQSVEITEYFEQLGGDIEAAAYGFYFLEMADYYTREGMDEGQRLNLLYMTVKALLNPKLDNRLVRLIYEMRSMVIHGEYPQMFQCIHCGKQVTEGVFSIADSGIYCMECKKVPKGAQPISGGAIYALQYMISAPLNHLYTFTLSPEVEKEVRSVVEQCMKWYVDREFRALEVLEQIMIRKV